MWTDWLVAFGICSLAAALEAACAGRDPMGQLKALNQPGWSPPTWLWVLIGLAWYGFCFAGLVRLMPFWPELRLPVILLALLMVLNAAANIPAFRMKRLDLAFYLLGPYWLLLGSFMWVIHPLDRLTTILFGIYSIYQIYAAAWCYALWRMNRNRFA